MKLSTEEEYEDLLGQWANLESALHISLHHAQRTEAFAERITQYCSWMRSLLKHDPDLGLYLLFQVASNSSAGYSASHALVCAVLCDLVAKDCALNASEHNTLVVAALTMNLGMTQLQDVLALQKHPPSEQQKTEIQNHPQKSVEMLKALGLSENLLLQTVARHHRDDTSHQPLSALAAEDRLSFILQHVDRYAAKISPRQTRAGLDPQQSINSGLVEGNAVATQVSQSLKSVVGTSPPGTLVQLDDGSTAMVRKRGALTDQPEVVVLTDHQGQRIRPLRLHRTAHGGPQIEQAVAFAAAALTERLSHHQILRLAA